MPSKRLLLGVAALVAAQILLNNLASTFLTESVELIVLRSVVVALFSAFIGGFIARKGIILPAIAIWIILWVAIIYTLYAIAAPVDPNPLPAIVEYNWAAFLGSGIATIVGAMLGQTLGTPRAPHVSAT